jgi:hypothetical protein
MKRERKKGKGAPLSRHGRAKGRIQKMIEAARSPFERRCLLKWSFREHGRAVQSAQPWERPVRCEYCGNWHLVER